MTNEWKCVVDGCPAWTIDLGPDGEPTTRCAQCNAIRPLITEVRRRPSFDLNTPNTRVHFHEARPGDVVWRCDNCGEACPTRFPCCGECGAQRPLYPELSVLRDSRYILLGWIVGTIGAILLMVTVGGFPAAGVMMFFLGEKLREGRN